MIREILDKDPNSWTAADTAELKDWLGPLGRLFSAKVWKLVQPLKVVVYFLALVFSIIRVALYTLLVLIPLLIWQRAKYGRSWVTS